MIKPVLTQTELRFAAKKNQPDTLPQRYYRKSNDTHTELSSHASYETVPNVTMGQRMRKFLGYLVLGAASVASGYGGYWTYNNYQKHVPTEQQVAEDIQLKGYRSVLGEPSKQVMDWTSGKQEMPANLAVKTTDQITGLTTVQSPNALVTHDKLAEMKQVQNRFHRAVIQLLSQSGDTADQVLAHKLSENSDQFNLQTAKLATELTAYLADHTMAGTTLELDKYLADQPQLASLTPREREYLAAHITMEFTEHPNAAPAIQELLNNTLLSKLAGFSPAEIQKIDNPAQLTAFFEQSTKNEALFPNLTGQERERLAEQGKAYLSSLSHQDVVPPAKELLALAFGLMALGGGLGIATAVKTNNSIQQKLAKRKENIEFFASNKPALKVMIDDKQIKLVEQQETLLSQSVETLHRQRSAALQGDPEVEAFFAGLYGRQTDRYNPQRGRFVPMPSENDMKEWYRNRAQHYFITKEERKIVTKLELLEKAVELIKADQKANEYLPELAFTDTASAISLGSLDDGQANSTEESFNRKMDQIDANVMNNIQSEINQRIFIQEIKDNLQAMIAKSKQSLPASLSEERRAEETQRHEESWQTVQEQALESSRKVLAAIISNRVNMEENRLEWQVTWWKRNHNADRNQILAHLTAVTARTQGMTEGSGNSLENLKSEVAVSDRVLEKRIASLAERQKALKADLEKARTGQSEGSK